MKDISCVLIPLPEKGGWGVAIGSVKRGHALDVLIERGLDVPEQYANDERIYLRGERMKFAITRETAKAWRDRFYTLPLEDQLNRIGFRFFRVVDAPDKDKVSVGVQYFQVFDNAGNQVYTDYFLPHLAEYKKEPMKYRIEKSVVRNILVTKEDYEKNKGAIVEVAAKASGIAGMMRDVKDIKRSKIKGSDRHQAFRITTNPNFYRNK